jgi:hypothetical protein
MFDSDGTNVRNEKTIKASNGSAPGLPKPDRIVPAPDLVELGEGFQSSRASRCNAQSMRGMRFRVSMQQFADHQVCRAPARKREEGRNRGGEVGGR